MFFYIPLHHNWTQYDTCVVEKKISTTLCTIKPEAKNVAMKDEVVENYSLKAIICIIKWDLTKITYVLKNGLKKVRIVAVSKLSK